MTVTAPSLLLPDDAPPVHDVWMSHGVAIQQAPTGFAATASTADAPVAMLENDHRRIYGVQFHPEVVHSPYGMGVLRRFLHERAAVERNWTMSSIVDEQVERIREQVGDGRAICALSGGVDSTVAAALVNRAIGHQLTCVYVDTGLMRKNESAEVTDTFRRHLGLELIHVEAADRYFRTARRRHRAGGQAQGHRRGFIRIFEEHTWRARRGRVPRAGHALSRTHRVVVASDGTAAVIKSHRNVGGLPEDMRLSLIEPLRDLFKDEVRRLGLEPGCRRDGVASAASPARAWACGSSARSPASAWRCCRRPSDRPPGDRRRRASNARSGSRSRCSPTSARSA